MARKLQRLVTINGRNFLEIVLILKGWLTSNSEKSAILNSGVNDGVKLIINFPSFVSILNSVISKTKRRVWNKLFTKGYLTPRRRAIGKSRLVYCRSNAYFLLICEEEIYSNMSWKLYTTAGLIFCFVHDLTSFRKLINISQIQLLMKESASRRPITSITEEEVIINQFVSAIVKDWSVILLK